MEDLNSAKSSTPVCNYFFVLFPSLCLALGRLDRQPQRDTLRVPLVVPAPTKNHSLVQKWVIWKSIRRKADREEDGKTVVPPRQPNRDRWTQTLDLWNHFKVVNEWMKLLTLPLTRTLVWGKEVRTWTKYHISEYICVTKAEQKWPSREIRYQIWNSILLLENIWWYVQYKLKNWPLKPFSYFNCNINREQS